LFFIGRGKSTRPAEAYCSTCPVQLECLAYSLHYGEYGIWSGVAEKERKVMRDNRGVLLLSEFIESLAVKPPEKNRAFTITAVVSNLSVGLFELEGPTDFEIQQLEAEKVS
jgi:hypothetical protein